MNVNQLQYKYHSSLLTVRCFFICFSLKAWKFKLLVVSCIYSSGIQFFLQESAHTVWLSAHIPTKTQTVCTYSSIFPIRIRIIIQFVPPPRLSWRLSYKSVLWYTKHETIKTCDTDKNQGRIEIENELIIDYGDWTD